MIIRTANPGDAAAFLDYALRNRDFLRPFEPARPDSAFTLDAMRDRLTPDQHRVPYLAFEDGRVVGQATLSNIARAAFQSCTLGYSVDEHEAGRGIATRMVRHAVREAFRSLGLHRVEAGTLLHNVASQRVLDRCGFQRIGVSPRHVRIAGSWQDHLLFAITIEDWTG